VRGGGEEEEGAVESGKPMGPKSKEDKKEKKEKKKVELSEVEKRKPVESPDGKVEPKKLNDNRSPPARGGGQEADREMDSLLSDGEDLENEELGKAKKNTITTKRKVLSEVIEKLGDGTDAWFKNSENETSDGNVKETLKILESVVSMMNMELDSTNKFKTKVNKEMKELRDGEAKRVQAEQESQETIKELKTELEVEKERTRTMETEIVDLKRKLEEEKNRREHEVLRVDQRCASASSDLGRIKQEVSTQLGEQVKGEVARVLNKEKGDRQAWRAELDNTKKTMDEHNKNNEEAEKLREVTNKEMEKTVRENRQMMGKVAEISSAHVRIEQGAEQDQMARLRNSFEFSSQPMGHVGGASKANLTEVIKSLGGGAAISGRDDPVVKNKVKENIKEVLKKKYGIEVRAEEIVNAGWKGKDEGIVTFDIEGGERAEEVGRAVCGKWKEGGDEVNGFVNKQTTFARRILAKILRKAKKLRTVERVFEEWDGSIHFSIEEKDRETAKGMKRLNIKANQKLEVFATPHKSNGYTLMTEQQLLLLMHMKDVTTGVMPVNGKNVKMLVAMEGCQLPPRQRV
jgi:hypothetical protein